MRQSSLFRWGLVVLAAAAMGAAGTYQFVWSSIRGPLGAQVGASEAALGTAFTLFAVAQTLGQFPAGWFRDRHGPQVPLFVGGLLVAGGYAGLGLAESTLEMYLFFGLGSLGGGFVYTVAVNTPVKWLTKRRGLGTGLVTMAFSAASVPFIPFVRGGVESAFAETLIVLGVVTGLACLIGVPFLRDPTDAELEAPYDDDAAIDDGAYTWRETVRTWQFWVLYAALMVASGVGLMLIGKVVAFAAGVGLPAAVATGAASLIALSDGAGIVVIGGASDRLGRERTVGAALVLCGLSLAGATLLGVGGLGGVFVIAVGAFAFFRSPVFSIFPSLVGEYYGAARSSENYAVLYTAKLWGGVLGGTAASLFVSVAGWSATFLLGAVLLLVVGAALTFLRPVGPPPSVEA